MPVIVLPASSKGLNWALDPLSQLAGWVMNRAGHRARRRYHPAFRLPCDHHRPINASAQGARYGYVESTSLTRRDLSVFGLFCDPCSFAAAAID